MANSIHEQAHADQHWAGDYFGPTGALEVARRQYEAAYEKVRIDSSNLVYMAWMLATMRLMSTVFSAIGHCLSQAKRPTLNNKFWYVIMAAELNGELHAAVRKALPFAGKIDAGQRDVLIASLLLLRFTNPTRGYAKLAAELINTTLDDKDAPRVSKLFAMARGSRLSHHFSKVDRDDFRWKVYGAIYSEAPDSAENTGPTVKWEDVARLARMIGDKECQRYAAKMSGSVDAKLKAGV